MRFSGIISFFILFGFSGLSEANTAVDFTTWGMFAGKQDYMVSVSGQLAGFLSITIKQVPGERVNEITWTNTDKPLAQQALNKILTFAFKQLDKKYRGNYSAILVVIGYQGLAEVVLSNQNYDTRLMKQDVEYSEIRVNRFRD